MQQMQKRLKQKKSNTTERIKGPTTVQREIRIGVTHVKKVF
jgi:hypothetical protein